MQNITQEDIGVFLSVIEWSEGCWNYPKRIQHCYNCAHSGLCKKECTDQNKRVQGLVRASICDDYIYDPKNYQAYQNDIGVIPKEKLAIFLKVLRASRDSRISISPKLPHCKQCLHIKVCNKKTRHYEKFWRKGLCNFLFAQGCHSFSFKKM
ncbi:MAG: hypothetical protein KAS07_03940 [Candidatus Pacebacteria bacterium]|nr:hypothetical protein [Candidatus Paceibacterota bacterium]